jgi:hypothetical protein
MPDLAATRSGRKTSLAYAREHGAEFSEAIRLDNIAGARQFKAFLRARKLRTQAEDMPSFKHVSEMASQTARALEEVTVNAEGRAAQAEMGRKIAGTNIAINAGPEPVNLPFRGKPLNLC